MLEQLKQIHISRKFNTELEQICSLLLAMGGLVEKQSVDVFESIRRGDLKLIKQVKQDRIKQFELQIDKGCEQIIIKRQPIAGDLRLILCIIKMSMEITQISNKLVSISKVVSDLNRLNKDLFLFKFDQLGKKLNLLLCKTLDAFARMDDSIAMNCCELNKEFNDECKVFKALLINEFETRLEQNVLLLSAVFAIDLLKQSGMHCQKICECISYAINGK